MEEIQKVYELTTNEKDGFCKWYVRGIKDDEEAKKVSLKGFGRKYYSPSLISYYDDYPSKYGTDWGKDSLTINQFIRMTRKEYLKKQKKEHSKYMQTGSSNLFRDKKLKAKKVGWRYSDTGNIYFENRKNRSDKNRKMGL